MWLRNILMIVLSLLLCMGCAAPTASPTPVIEEPLGECLIAPQSTCAVEPAPTCAPGSAQPVVYGMWMREADENQGIDRALLNVSEWSVYLVESEGTAESPYVRELFYEIDSVDWVNSVFTMSLKWVRVNGKYSGFSTPLSYLKVNIDENSLFYSLGDEEQGVPADALIGPFVRK